MIDIEILKKRMAKADRLTEVLLKSDNDKEVTRKASKSTLTPKQKYLRSLRMGCSRW